MRFPHRYETLRGPSTMQLPTSGWAGSATITPNSRPDLGPTAMDAQASTRCALRAPASLTVSNVWGNFT